MNKHITYTLTLLFSLLPFNVFAQQERDILYEIERTLEVFTSDLNNTSLDTDGFKKSLDKFSQYGPQMEPRVFTHNGIRPGSFTRWVEAYITDSLLCMPVTHTFDVSHGTLRKVSNDKDDRRYSVDVLMSWEYVDQDGNIVTRRSPVSFTIIYTRNEKWVQIMETNGRWPSLKQQYGTALDYAQELYRQKKYEQSLEIYRLLADKENAEARYRLGNFYYSGDCGVPQDAVTAVYWYRKAAKQGHPDAQTSLAVLYHRGEGGLSKDFEQAVLLLMKAVVQGNECAMSNLGTYYMEGKGGLPKDTLAAFMLFQRSGNQRNHVAQYKLGLLYETGLSFLAQDLGKAYGCYAKAADSDYAPAQYKLGYFYENGFGGLSRNPSKAVEYYIKSANQDNVDAQYMLGHHHYTGQCSLSMNKEEGLKWLEKAAGQDHTEALYELSIHYLHQKDFWSPLKALYYWVIFCWHAYTLQTIVVSLILIGLSIFWYNKHPFKFIEYLQNLLVR